MDPGSRFVKLLKEPPLRLFARKVFSMLPVSASTRGLWDISPRPNYLSGVLLAAQQAQEEGVAAISVIEFGVAGGTGLLALQAEAEAVERETGVHITVFGFDNGPGGLPELVGDHRDHPDAWRPGDYPMDEAKLRARLAARTTLILGNVRETVPAFVRDANAAPIGFMAVDVDLYSSTTHALKILTLPGRKLLRRTFIYFDDIDQLFTHRYAGELLAIDEFNKENASIKIDRIRGFNIGRPFPDKPYLHMMYVAHDLEAIANLRPARDRGPLMTHVLR